MKEVELQESRRTALDDYLEVLGILGKKINEVEGILREKAEVTEEAMWLMSIVGIGFHNALLALSEIGEIERFSNTKSLPENLQSAKSKKGRKGGNCCNSSSHGRVGLLGTNKEGILQRMKEGNKSLVFFMIP